MNLQVLRKYLEYLYDRTHQLYEKHKKCHRDLKNVSVKIPPWKNEVSYVFNHSVVVEEVKCDAKDIQEFLKTLKDVLLILQSD